MTTSLTEFGDGYLYIPPELDDFGLDVPSFRLYAHIVRLSRSGVCTDPIDDLADSCRMNRKTAYKALQTLQAHQLVAIVKRSGRTHEILVTGVSEWIRNPSPPEHPALLGWIYMIQAVGTGRYKIGFTTNVNSRLAQLASQSAFPLSLVASHPSDDMIRDEMGWHKLFEKQRVHGEWFELSTEQEWAFRDAAKARSEEA